MCGAKTDESAHAFGDWTTVKQPTETDKGSRSRTCTSCGYVETQELGVLPHAHQFGAEWKFDADGHWHECACGERSEVEAHTLAWVEDKKASETEKGSKHQECAVCGYKGAAVEIPATGGASDSDDNGNNGNTGAADKPAKTAAVPQTGDPVPAAAGVVGALACVALAATVRARRAVKR